MRHEKKVMETLKKADDWISITDVAEETGHNRATVSKHLWYLAAKGEVEHKQFATAQLFRVKGKQISEWNDEKTIEIAGNSIVTFKITPVCETIIKKVTYQDLSDDEDLEFEYNHSMYAEVSEDKPFEYVLENKEENPKKTRIKLKLFINKPRLNWDIETKPLPIEQNIVESENQLSKGKKVE